MEVLVIIAVFGMVFGGVYYFIASRRPATDEVIQRRLDGIAPQPRAEQRIRLARGTEETFWEQVAAFFFGDREMPGNYTKMSRLLHQAGYRGARAIRIFWGVRIFLTLAFGFGGVILAFLFGFGFLDLLKLLTLGVGIGYLLPYSTVRGKAKSRVLQMKETLPDTLDLLVVCVEAGMGMDAALNRVAKEQSEQGLVIGEEIALACQEIQAGAPRKEALIRLADRMGVEEFRGLVTFITQTDELGGSIARSLRVYAATMRDKRSQAAEEMARKAVIKLIFPLAFLIMPAIFILVLGPPGLKIIQILANPLR